jgi:hypothetical protein
VAAATISETDGTFAIYGLPKNDQFYIYTSPISQIGLPTKYNNVRYDFCTSSKKYRGSLFQACGSSFEGHPQAVKLSSSIVNVGNITIRCGIDVPTSYIQNKNLLPADFDVQENVISGVGNSFTGFFSPSELLTATPDYFQIDLSNINWTDVSPTGDLYVDLKIVNQAFYSPYKAVVKVTRNSSTTTVSPQYIQEGDGWLNLETILKIPINRLDPSDNDFEVTITPSKVDVATASLPFLKADYFPVPSYFEDSQYFYLASVSIVKDAGGGNFTLASSKNDQLSDNSRCPDAPNTYALTNYTIKGAALSSKARKGDDGIACGSVDLNSTPGSGPGGFFIGLIISLFLCHLASSFNNRINKSIKFLRFAKK